MGSVVLVQVDPVLLAQPADLLIELPGDVDISSGDRPGDALGAEEPVDLGRRHEDAVVCSGAENKLHVGPGQVEVTRGQKEGGVWPGVRQQALRGGGERGQTAASLFLPSPDQSEERGGLTCVTCSSTRIPRGFIWTRGKTQVSSSPSLASSSSQAGSCCLARAPSNTSIIRLRATAENCCRSPVFTVKSRR